MYVASEYKDIIGELQERRLLSCIGQDILQLLDVESLENAEEVSQYWKNTVIAGRLWKKLLKRNVEKIKDWEKMHQTLSMQKRFHEKPDVDQCSLEDEHQWHKHQCLLVHKTLQIVDRNWQTGSGFKQTELAYAPIKTFTLTGLNFLIIRHQITHIFGIPIACDVTLDIFNRWTSEMESIPVPPDDFTDLHMNSLNLFHCNGSKLVIRKVGNSIITAWQLKVDGKFETTHQLAVLDDSAVGPLYRNGPLGPGHYAVERVRLCSKGRYLLSAMVPFGENDGSRRSQLTLREFDEANQDTVKHHLVLEENVGFVDNLYVDESRVLVALSIPELENQMVTISQRVIHVLSTATFDQIQTIDIGNDQFSNSWNWYTNGIIISYLHSSWLRVLRVGFKVWDSDSGNSVGLVHHTSSYLSDLILIAGKYVIGIDDDKRLYVWGLRPLKTIENEQHLANSTLPLLWSMQLDLSQLSDMRINGAAADEYQIYIFAHHWDTGEKKILTLDFLDLDSATPNWISRGFKI